MHAPEDGVPWLGSSRRSSNLSALGLWLARVAARSGAGIQYVLGKRPLFGIADLNYDDYWPSFLGNQIILVARPRR